MRVLLSQKSPSLANLKSSSDDESCQQRSEIVRYKQQCAELRSRLAEKQHDEHELNDQLEAAASRERELMAKVKSMQKDHKAIGSIPDASKLHRELSAREEEKNLLQARHNALTSESQNLQDDLVECRKEIEQLRGDLDRERRLAKDSELCLQTGAQESSNRLNAEIVSLRHQLDEQRKEAKQAVVDSKHKLRDVAGQRDRAESQTGVLQRTIDQLKVSEKAISEQQKALQSTLDTERQRKGDAEKYMAQMIADLKASRDSVQASFAQGSLELRQVKEKLRQLQDCADSSGGRVQALEDEVDVLQGALEEEGEKFRQELTKLKQDSNNLHYQLQSKEQDISKVEQEKKGLQQLLQAKESQLAQMHAHQEDAQAKPPRPNSGQMDSHQAKAAQVDATVQLTALRSERRAMQRLQAVHADVLKELERLKSAQMDTSAVERSRSEARAAVQQLRSERNAEQDQIRDLEAEILRLRQSKSSDAGTTAQATQQHFAASRIREAEFFKREVSMKEKLRTLRKENADLEKELYEIRTGNATSGICDFSTANLTKTDEISGMRHQLSDTQRQLKVFIAESRESDRNALRRIADIQKLSQQQHDCLEAQRKRLERQIGELKLERGGRHGAERTIDDPDSHWRTRVNDLEIELVSARSAKPAGASMGIERKELHDMLKSTKLGAEDLRFQLKDCSTRLESSLAREENAQAKLRVADADCRLKENQVSALSAEIDDLRRQYEEKKTEVAANHQWFERERRRLTLGTKRSEADAGLEKEIVKKLEQEAQDREVQHAMGLKEVSKRMQLLKSRCKREAAFRKGLTFEKRYMQLQIEMYQAW